MRKVFRLDTPAFYRGASLKAVKQNYEQIAKQIIRARRDLNTSRAILGEDSEWSATIAYHAMLRTGRAYIYSKGYLPIDGAQHKTVVELTGKLLGRDYSLLVEKFERMRRKRNLFFYDTDLSESLTDAKNAMKVAATIIDVIEEKIKGENPKINFNWKLKR